MDLSLNNLQRLTCNKTLPTNNSQHFVDKTFGSFKNEPKVFFPTQLNGSKYCHITVPI